MNNNEAYTDAFSTAQPEVASEVLQEYAKLLQKQSEEREVLLEQIERLLVQAHLAENVDTKVDNILKLLLELKHQYLGHEPQAPPLENPAPQVTITKDSGDEEVKVLVDLLDEKKEEVSDKDNEIATLNEELERLAIEKSSLVGELEKLNQVIDNWKSQVNILEKLASSDPRYKIIRALRQHDALTEIQLAFTLGSSIMQIRKFVADLTELNLIQRRKDGKLIWIGGDEDSLFA